MSDTPRTDEQINGKSCTRFEVLAGDSLRNASVPSEFTRQLERELNAAQQRIKRLEKAGDFLSRYLREMPYASDYLAQVDERILRISNWRRAKEDNL